MKQKTRNTRGAILVITAIFVVAAISLAALVVDVGMFYLARRELDGVTELAGRAAIVRFHEVQNANHQQRITAALARAQEITQANQIRGLGGVPLGPIGTLQSPGESGYIEFGQYYAETPPCVNGVCPVVPCGNIPCFEPAPITGGIVNAARAQLRTAQTRPIATYFAKMMGIDSVHMSSNRLVVIAPRCAVFLVDLSNSMTVDTYRPLAIDPVAPGFGGAFSYYAFTEEAVQKGQAFYQELITSGLTPAQIEGLTYPQVQQRFSTSANPFVAAQTKGSLAWFSLLTHRPFRPSGTPTAANVHYANDYVLTNVKFGNTTRPYYIDAFRDASHRGPEPFRTVMEVIHNLIKFLRQSSLSTDYVQLAGFDYDIRGTGLVSRDRFALLQQITNLDNGPVIDAGGLQPQIHPNFTDYGMLPREDAPTNIYEPLYVAIENLSDPAMCPANAEKHIFIVSDFVFNTVPDGFPSLGALRDPAGPYRFLEQFQLESNSNLAFFSDTYNGWEYIHNWSIPGILNAGNALHPLGTRSLARWPITSPQTLPVIARQAGGGISVHTIIVGDHVGPHLLNRQDPGWLGTYAASGRYRFPGYLESLTTWPNSYMLASDFGANYHRIFDGSYGNPMMGANYRPFLRPNWTAFWLASNMNGMFCPIRPPPPSAECITDPFDPSKMLHDEFAFRAHNTPQYFSPDCTSKSEQFTRCVQDTFVRGVPVYPAAEYNN